MRSKFDLIFAGGDPAAVRNGVVEALVSGGQAAAEAYEFSKPRSDGYTFGVDLWRFVWHDLEAAFRDYPGASVRRSDGSFLVELGSCPLYPVSMRTGGSSGPTERVEISERRRTLLSKPTAHLPLELPPVVIIAFAGRPDSGVVRAWVGVATLTEDDTLNWEWCEELPIGGPNNGIEVSSGLGVEAPAFHQAPEPTLELGLLAEDELIVGEDPSGG